MPSEFKDYIGLLKQTISNQVMGSCSNWCSGAVENF